MQNRWLILFLLFATRLGMGFQFQSVGSVSADLVHELGFSNTEIGALIGMFMLPGVILAFPSGWLGRWASDRSIVTVGLLSLSIGGVGFLISKDFLPMGVGRFVCGVGFVLTTIYFTKMTVDWFQDRELATALSLLIISWPGGIALSQIIHPHVALNFGWQWAIATASIFCFVAAMAISSLYQPPPKILLENDGQPQGQRFTSYEWLKTSMAAFSWSFYNAGYLVFLSFSVNALIESGTANYQATVMVSIASFLVMISIPLGGVVSDKLNIPRFAVILSSSVATLCLLTLSYEHFALIACIIFGTIGMCSGGIIIALTGQAIPSEKRAYGMGIYQTFYFVFTAPAPLVGGWLYDLTNSANSAMAFGAFLFTLSGIFYFVFLRINLNGKV